MTSKDTKRGSYILYIRPTSILYRIYGISGVGTGGAGGAAAPPKFEIGGA